MLEDIKAVIFDMDGTLVDSMWVWQSIDDDYVEKYHLVLPEGFHDEMEGMSFTETAEHYKKTFPKELTQSVEEIKEEWLKMSEDKYTRIVPFKDGVREFLQYLKDHKIRVGIATSNDRTLVEKTLKAKDAEQYFDSISTACEVKAGKPAPDVYLDAAKKLGVDPKDCLIFEDVPNGILAGKNAGMKACGVDDEYTRCQEGKKKELADYYIYSFKDIFDKTYEVL